MADSLDALDLRLIRYLQDNPRASYSTIARLSGVHETTVKRRVDDLIARRIIQPAMIANIYRLGYKTRATIMLKVDLKHLNDIAEQLRAYPETAFVGIAAGRYNVSCLVVVPTLSALTRFLVERIAPLEGVRDTEVAVVPRILKLYADWRIPIEELMNGDHPGDDLDVEDDGWEIDAPYLASPDPVDE
jgi:DNA-binding Lrp family transcriptional regulator